MKDVEREGRGKSIEDLISSPKDFGEATNELCEKALNEAKGQLHPLLRDVQLERLDERSEFVQTFKSALELRIARKLAGWQPGIQAVFRFDEKPAESWETWDGSIHLLVKVPRLSDGLRTLGRKFDRSLVKYLKQLNWPRFRERDSILEVQQVTPNELRHGVSYGAMFYAVYSVPVKVWPPDRKRFK